MGGRVGVRGEGVVGEGEGGGFGVDVAGWCNAGAVVVVAQGGAHVCARAHAWRVHGDASAPGRRRGGQASLRSGCIHGTWLADVGPRGQLHTL